ncbi:MAG: hypothetical protein M1821_006672 [Bathelium mastoideum]|nr:MAG: hypothetical protein M1821_006672 [Bathelium mastoideum]
MAQTSVAFHNYPHTYHDDRQSAYLLPNSSPEQERLAEQAAGLKALVGGNVLHTKNLENIPEARFLDIGCGTGAVTYEIARQFPKAKVYGIDLSTIQILDNKPPNVEFIKGNIFDLAGNDPRFQLGSFDFVFSRLLICGMTDWVKYLKTVASLLKPGAPCEFQEFTWEHYINGERVDTKWKWMQACKEGSRRQGLDLFIGKTMPGYARDAGLTDIGQKEYAVPTGRWVAKSNPQAAVIGNFFEESETTFFLLAIKRMVDETQCSEEERKGLAEECERVCSAEREGRAWPLIVTTARKPE